MFAWLHDITPEFNIDGGQVTVLATPSDFYATLKAKAASVQRRVLIASLYLGTGPLEDELVQCLERALASRAGGAGDGSSFKMRVLLDYSRGTRGDNANSCTMLQPLKARFPGALSISLFRSPLLRGVLNHVLPARWNEVMGVQHMKIYLFDDDVIISGANLSDQYFVNRQDRYVVIERCPALADFYTELADAVASCCFELNIDGTLRLHDECVVHPFKGSFHDYKCLLKQKLESSVARWREKTRGQHVVGNTQVYPLLQMGCVDVCQDDLAIKHAFSLPDAEARLDFASGYFNMTDEYADLLLKKSENSARVLMASPQANGFFNGQGLSGYVPMYYTHVAKRFYQKMQQLTAARSRINLFEYYRPGWTFHAKGLWFTLPQEHLPSATFVGSSNYGYRSVHRDLETQIVLVTSDERLKQQLHEERERLFSFGFPLHSAVFRRPDHYVSLWARLVSRFLSTFF